MTGALVSMTLRALLNRRRTLLLALLGVLMIVIVALCRLSDPSPDQALEVTRRLLSDLALGVLLPLVAVIVGTAAIGSELDDGTIVYLLARPVPRWRIVLVKLFVAWLVVSLLEKRLAEGKYGLSVESGEAIPDARLEAVPWAERTVEEQARYER